MSSSSKNFLRRIVHWLEYHWAIPAYGGWVLIGIAISFFGAATNTMAGWLYVLSGMLLSLLGLNFILAIANLKKIKVTRLPIAHIHAEDELTLEIAVSNLTKKSKTLIEIIDQIPENLGQSINHSVEVIPSQSNIKLTSYIPTKRRGIYHWQNITLKSAAPFGLFYCSRQRQVESRAVIYPKVLSLHSCPFVDDIGNQEVRKRQSQKLYQNSTEGVTKSLRKYRHGDAMRLIHWRSSARLGELQVRELETITGGEEIIICLDNSCQWQSGLFEQALIAVASMYFYASRQQLPVNLWIANLGIVHGSQVILETLAGITDNQTMTASIPDTPVIWLSPTSQSLDLLPQGSRWFLFPEAGYGVNVTNSFCQGIIHNSELPLISQLQQPLNYSFMPKSSD